MAKKRPTSRPRLEALEGRLVPYCLSGSSWANPNISASYMPDGALIRDLLPSNLSAVYESAYPREVWQREVARALQTWASVTPLNFRFVADDGSPQGTPELIQGDSRFGDIRLGGYDMGSGILGLGWDPSTTTRGGDVELNTRYPFPIGSMPDLFSVLLHETGHALGLCHTPGTVMAGGIWAVYAGLFDDDIAGIRALYEARRPDAYDAAAPNDTFASATALSLSAGAANFTADLTTLADVDYYRVTVPSGSDGSAIVTLDTGSLSLLSPRLSVYDAAPNLVAVAEAGGAFGTAVTVNLTGLAAGQTYFLVADGATGDVFGMGAYRLGVQFGGGSLPPPPSLDPDSSEVNDTAATAPSFGTITRASAASRTLHSGADVDYYAFVAASRGTYVLSLSFAPTAGTLSAAVLSAQQSVLAGGQSQSGTLTLSLRASTGRLYYVRVSSPSGDLLTYDLGLARSGGGGGGGGGGALHAYYAQDLSGVADVAVLLQRGKAHTHGH